MHRPSHYYSLALLSLLLPLAAAHAALEAPTLASAHHWNNARVFATGERFEQGRDLPRSPQRAYAFFCLAAGRGHPQAAYALGWIYLNGRGVTRNPGAAVSWLRYAAHHGAPHAKRLLKRLKKLSPGPDDACPLPGKRAADPTQARRWVRAMAQQYGLDSHLLEALVAAESSFDIHARSNKNARGLMQLLPATAKRFGVRNISDPVENIRGGMAYLSWLLRQFNGRVPLALAAYNAGENAVRRYQGIPPYKETRHYVARITQASLTAAAKTTVRPASPRSRRASRLARILRSPPS